MRLASGNDSKVENWEGSVCKDCSQSQVARDKVRKEAKACEDEIDGSGLEGLADCSETEAEE